MANPLGRYGQETDDEQEYATVVLVDAPLVIWQRATEHHDELMREMALLALAKDRPELPNRLLQLVDVLGSTYGAAGDRYDDLDRHEALARGEDRATLTFSVPLSQGPRALQMRALLDEADEYCRTHLLTLQQPPVEAAFARWYVEQFARQCAGGDPEPWPGPWS